MHKLSRSLIAIAILGSLFAMSLRADEKKIDLDKVPKPVMDAVKAKFPDAKFSGASTETEDGKTIYELAFTVKDRKYEVECQADGTILAIDKVLDAKELPAEVTRTLDEKYADAKYDVIEKVTKKDKIEYYEFELTEADNKKVQVNIDPSGKVIKEEKKDKKYVL